MAPVGSASDLPFSGSPPDVGSPPPSLVTPEAPAGVSLAGKDSVSSAVWPSPVKTAPPSLPSASLGPPRAAGMSGFGISLAGKDSASASVVGVLVGRSSGAGGRGPPSRPAPAGRRAACRRGLPCPAGGAARRGSPRRTPGPDPASPRSAARASRPCARGPAPCCRPRPAPTSSSSRPVPRR